MSELAGLAPLVDAGGGIALAVVVYLELRKARSSLDELARSIAVLLDRRKHPRSDP